MIRIWEDTPKRGETYSGWFASRSEDGHVQEIKGGFATEAEARQYFAAYEPKVEPFKWGQPSA